MSRKKRENKRETVQAAEPEKKAPRPYVSYVAGLSVIVLAIAVAGYAVKVSMQGASVQPRNAANEAPAKPAEPAEPPPPFENKPLRDFKVFNAHEHLMARQFLDKYLRAADETGVTSTLFVASSEYTLKGAKFDQAKGNDENTEEIIAVAREFPGKVVPYCAIHPGDPEKLAKLKKFVDEGAQGLKLYTGHGNFYNQPLDSPEMMPVYAYCNETRLPICWHVNIVKYAAEFERVMSKFPKLIVIVPHFGVTFFRPQEPPFREFDRMMSTYPNLFTDTSFGTRGILIDGLEAISRDPRPFREFIAKHSDRVLFGTDMVITGNKEKSVKWIADVIRACRQVLEQDTYHFYMGAKGSPYASKSANNEKGIFHGLALNDGTLRKIYEDNYKALVALRTSAAQ